jgi:hypothetical protein
MYSNKKDQIKLENVYLNIHNENLDEMQAEPLEHGVVVASIMSILPSILNYIKHRYKLDTSNIKNKIYNILNKDENKNEFETQGVGFVRSHIIEILTHNLTIPITKELIPMIQKFIPDDHQKIKLSKMELDKLTNQLIKKSMGHTFR